MATGGAGSLAWGRGQVCLLRTSLCDALLPGKAPCRGGARFEGGVVAPALAHPPPPPPVRRRLLPGGLEAKLMVDRAIALVKPVGDLLADIKKCKVRRGPDARQGDAARALVTHSTAWFWRAFSRGRTHLCRSGRAPALDDPRSRVVSSWWWRARRTLRARCPASPWPATPRPCCAPPWRTTPRASWACTTSSATFCSSPTGEGG